MKKNSAYLIYLAIFFLFLLFPAWARPGAGRPLQRFFNTQEKEQEATPPPDEVVHITFMHFNDLHAHLVPHMDRVPDGPLGQKGTTTKVEERGGLARLATLVKRIRGENPNSILMNIGDTFHGGVEALFTNGSAIADPVNALGIDIGVPGNWDFAYGPLVTRMRYTKEQSRTLFKQLARFMPSGEVKGPEYLNLAANVTYTFPLNKVGQTMLPPTSLINVAGVRIGFIGITSDIVPYMYKPLAFGFSFLEGETNYKNLINRYAKQLRKQGAVIVAVMSELGIQKDYRLAQIVDPGAVNVFFSAHTHETCFVPLTSKSGALVMESGNDGYLGRWDVRVQGGRIIDTKWKLMPIDHTIPEDPAMKALVDRARKPFLAKNVNLKIPMPMMHQTLTAPIDTVVGHTDIPLDRRDSLESTFNNSMTDMLKKMTGSQLATTPGFRYDAVIPQAELLLEDNTLATGDITLEDVYHFFPVAYTISTGQVSGRNIKKVIEDLLTSVYSADVFNQRGGWVDGLSGLDITLNLANPDGKRLIDVKLSETGKSVSDDVLLTITGCSRPLEPNDLLCSHPGFINVTAFENPDTHHPWTAIDIFVEALKKGYLPSANRKSIKDLSGILIWPEAPFVQPLKGVE